MENSQSLYKGASLIVAFLLLSVGIGGGLWLLGQGIEGGKLSKTITLTGSAKKKVDSDLAKWTIGLSRHASPQDVKGAYTALKNDGDALRQYAKSRGVDEKAITFLPASTDPVYEQLPNYAQSQKIVEYIVRQEVRFESGNLDAVEKLAKEATQLIDKGIILDYQRTEYFYTKLDDLRPELFAAATKDAKVRANAIAEGTGVKVGDLQSARTGVIQVLTPNSTDVSDYGSYDLSTKEKEITATVNVAFALKR